MVSFFEGITEGFELFAGDLLIWFSAARRGTNEFERFVFYRGLGSFALPLSSWMDDEGALNLGNNGLDPLPGATFLEMDFLAPEAPQALLRIIGGPPDLVLSDMAANTTGHARTDQIRTGALAEAAAEFALEHLAPGGAFVTKAFQGGLDAGLLARLKQNFESVKHAKPKASRAESSEVYLVAMGRKR